MRSNASESESGSEGERIEEASASYSFSLPLCTRFPVQERRGSFCDNRAGGIVVVVYVSVSIVVAIVMCFRENN